MDLYRVLISCREESNGLDVRLSEHDDTICAVTVGSDDFPGHILKVNKEEAVQVRKYFSRSLKMSLLALSTGWNA